MQQLQKSSLRASKEKLENLVEGDLLSTSKDDGNEDSVNNEDESEHRL